MTTHVLNAAFDRDATVGQLVAQRPSLSRVFEELGIDYCCGGKKKLSEVCANKKLDLAKVTARLVEEMTRSAEDETADPMAMTLSDLTEHIVNWHHGYLRDELPRLMRMIRRVAKVHGEQDGRLTELEPIFAEFEEELYCHMEKEEKMLFPAIRQIERGDTTQSFPFASVAHPIRMMEMEHDSAGDALAKLRTLTDDFKPPAWACNTYRAMIDGLADVERDMHHHVHKENNVLFPRALEAERRA